MWLRNALSPVASVRSSMGVLCVGSAPVTCDGSEAAVWGGLGSGP